MGNTTDPEARKKKQCHSLKVVKKEMYSRPKLSSKVQNSASEKGAADV